MLYEVVDRHGNGMLVGGVYIEIDQGVHQLLAFDRPIHCFFICASLTMQSIVKKC